MENQNKKPEPNKIKPQQGLPQPSDVSKEEHTWIYRAKEYLQIFLNEVIDLEHGVDKRATISEIKNKNTMSGANAWMLMCSIVIASIGLDLDSPAVIIGAMLISPLMSPILGLGLGVAINDREMLKKSLTNFGMALLIALLTSFIYFAISPINQLTSQIEARTEPTFLDIIIAFFGGIAGIISIARKDLSTTLPGVAIATALMPPICVTGFGLANGNAQIALNSFYLFFLNTFFVALATYGIIRFLNFPHRDFLNKKDKRRNLIYTGIFSLFITIPSIIIFSSVIERVNNQRKVQTFLDTAIGEDKIYVDDYQLVEGDSINQLVLKVYGDKINRGRKEEYRKQLEALDLMNTVVEIIPTSEIKMDRLQQLESQLDGMERIANRLEVVKQEKVESDDAIDMLKLHIESMRMDTTSFHQLSKEIKAINDNVESITFGNSQTTDFENYEEDVPLLIINWKDQQKDKEQQKEQELQLANFVKIALKRDTIGVIFMK